MSKLKKLGVISLVILSPLIFRALYLHISISDLVSQSELATEIYSANDGARFSIDRKEYKEFVSEVVDSNTAWVTGKDASEWSHLCDINLIVSDEPVYQMAVYRGEGIKSKKVIASLRRVTKFGEYYYKSHYITVSAFQKLNKITNSRCI